MCVLYKKALLVAQQDSNSITKSTNSVLEERPSRQSPDISSYSDSNSESSPRRPECTQRSNTAKRASKKAAEVSVPRPGEVATLMSVDAGRVVNIMCSFHELWSLPLQMVIALYLLYLQVGVL